LRGREKFGLLPVFASSTVCGEHPQQPPRRAPAPRSAVAAIEGVEALPAAHGDPCGRRSSPARLAPQAQAPHRGIGAGPASAPQLRRPRTTGSPLAAEGPHLPGGRARRGGQTSAPPFPSPVLVAWPGRPCRRRRSGPAQNRKERRSSSSSRSASPSQLGRTVATWPWQVTAAPFGMISRRRISMPAGTS
jgi:hypothetical protein